MQQRAPGVTLFDLDGVLTTQDTMAALIAQRLRRRPFRVLVVLPIYAVALIAGPHRGVAAKANRLATRITFTGMDERSYRQMAGDAGSRMALQPGFMRPDLVEACRTAQDRRVVIITASEHYLVRALLDASGFPDIELIASHLTFSNRGPRIGVHNVGSQKVRNLRRAGVPLEDATFYTDSASDLPLALAAARAVIVYPGRRSRRRLLAARPDARIIE